MATSARYDDCYHVLDQPLRFGAQYGVRHRTVSTIEDHSFHRRGKFIDLKRGEILLRAAR